MPTLGLPCASAEAENASEPSTRADRMDLSSFMFHSRVFNVGPPRAPGASFPGVGRRKDRDPFFDVGVDEVGELFRRAAQRVGTLTP
jgi:hypothetical protein